MREAAVDEALPAPQPKPSCCRGGREVGGDRERVGDRRVALPEAAANADRRGARVLSWASDADDPVWRMQLKPTVVGCPAEVPADTVWIGRSVGPVLPETASHEHVIAYRERTPRSLRIARVECGSAPGSWVKSAWPHLRPNAHDWSRSARYACGYCLPMALTSRAS